MTKNIGGNYYDKHNSSNPIVKWMMKKFYGTFIDILKDTPGQTLVDIGCGEGHLTNIIYNECDFEIKALEMDGATALHAGALYPHLDVQQRNIINFGGQYDILIASEVLEHVEEYPKAIKNCATVAKTCVFSVPREPWFRLANVARLKYLPRFGNTPGHVNNWTKGDFKKLLEGYFDHVEIQTTTLWTVAVCKND